MAIRPATSDMGVSNGREPSSASTVSYAMHTAPLSTMAWVSGSDDAKWK